MKIDIETEIKTEILETVDIHIEFNPQIENEENMAAFVVTLVDMVKNYKMLQSTLDMLEDQDV